MKTLEKGRRVKYIGKGFLGFNPEQPFMTVTSANNSGTEIGVDYNGYEMVVRITEVETPDPERILLEIKKQKI